MLWRVFQARRESDKRSAHYSNLCVAILTVHQAIFEFIATENAYVRDLQLIVEVYITFSIAGMVLTLSSEILRNDDIPT
jgi:surface polysaccharide O-acyltransferase-like enzyme